MAQVEFEESNTREEAEEIPFDQLPPVFYNQYLLENMTAGIYTLQELNDWQRKSRLEQALPEMLPRLMAEAEGPVAVAFPGAMAVFQNPWDDFTDIAANA